MHGLIFETSVCYWQNQPGCYLSGLLCRRDCSSTAWSRLMSRLLFNGKSSQRIDIYIHNRWQIFLFCQVFSNRLTSTTSAKQVRKNKHTHHKTRGRCSVWLQQHCNIKLCRWERGGCAMIQEKFTQFAFRTQIEWSISLLIHADVFFLHLLGR